MTWLINHRYNLPKKKFLLCGTDSIVLFWKYQSIQMKSLFTNNESYLHTIASFVVIVLLGYFCDCLHFLLYIIYYLYRLTYLFCQWKISCSCPVNYGNHVHVQSKNKLTFSLLLKKLTKHMAIYLTLIIDLG